MLTIFDFIVLLVLGFSVLRGLWRGLVAETLGLIGWIVAFIIAVKGVSRVAPYLPAHWPGGQWTQFALAFALIVIVVLLAASVLNVLLNRLVGVVGLGTLNSSLGMLFGLLRGFVLVVALAAVLASITDLPQQRFWREALLRPYVESGVRIMKRMLPDALARYVQVHHE
ncbi:CvpA family protein [Mycoavidus sp. B2-EB]|uniref:CvpA family protein n=1 Tax=Mycoavidus sp. B2-EB TaxID=2651972 RepID=UPI0016281B41|nr:CvpA family protein [Mycoavidus sp. B2-EB]BBO60114.1 bacteriocin production protein [Mycoavidus sp. B2-EB]